MATDFTQTTPSCHALNFPWEEHRDRECHVGPVVGRAWALSSAEQMRKKPQTILAVKQHAQALPIIFKRNKDDYMINSFSTHAPFE